MKEQVSTFEKFSALESVLSELQFLQSFVHRIGINVGISNPEAEAVFLSWESPRQLEHLKKVSDYVSIFRNMNMDSKEINALDFEIECLQRALWKYGLFARDAFKDYIRRGDIVEIYNIENVQIYRNFEFLRHCSYTLMDIMTREWMDLYERPQKISEQLYIVTQKVFKDQVAVKASLPTHIMKETASENGRCFETDLNWFLPLFNAQGKCIAFLATISAQVVELDNVADNIFMI